MSLKIILKNGERPLFKSLALLETMYRDNQTYQTTYESITTYDIIKDITQMQAILEIIKLRNLNSTHADISDLFDNIINLPLIFNHQQVKKWEEDHSWNRPEYNLYTSDIVAYENELSSQNPSKAYVITNDVKKMIWKKWFNNNKKDVMDVLENSIQRYVLWEEKRNKQQLPLFENINKIVDSFGLPLEYVEALPKVLLLSHHQSELFDIYMKECDAQITHPFIQIFSKFEKALNIKENMFMDFFKENSPCVHCGIFNSFTSLTVENNKWSSVWKKLYSFPISDLNTPSLDKQDITKYFLKPLKIGTIDIENWSYIASLKNLMSALSKQKPLKILIHGPQGVGKTSLVANMLNHIDMLALEPVLKDSSKNEHQERVQSLRIANQMLKSFANTALVIDQCEENFDLLDKYASYLSIKDSCQIWIAKNLQKIHPNLISAFDFILEVEEPPVSFRQELAQKYFQDPDIAMRIAQSVKTPLEIIQLKNWCQLSEDFSWKNINIFLSNISRAKNTNQENALPLNLVDNNKPLVELVASQETKIILNSLVHLFNNPNEYKKMNAQCPKGILLVGPPGTGKTHFARQLSHICQVPMFAPESSILAKDPKNISTLFKEIKRYTPCILFIDEIDTLISNPKEMFTINLEKQKIVNAFLAQLDGIQDNEGILVVGTTHRYNNLDPAAIRSRRLSEVLYFNLPESSERIHLWKSHLENKPLDKIDLDILAKSSVGFSGADIAEAVNKAAVSSVQNNQAHIEMKNLLSACDDVFWGIPNSARKMSQEQIKMTAYHEAGHALIALKNDFLINRITIRPRKNFLGAVHYNRPEGVYNLSKNSIYAEIEVALAGICAEEVIFQYYENGGTQDLEVAHKLFAHAVLEAGLGKQGPIYMTKIEDWSEQRKMEFEQEEKELMNSLFKNVTQWLDENKNLLDELAELLIAKKEVSHVEVDYFYKKIKDKPILLKNQSNEMRSLHQENKNL